MKNRFLKSHRVLFSKGNLIIILLHLFFFTPLFSQLPTAQQIATQMRIGWNMGNTLEAMCGETAWGGAYTTQRLIDSVKAAGFNTVRLPVAWFCHSDTITSEIDTAWKKWWIIVLKTVYTQL